MIYVTTDNTNLLSEIIDELLTKKRVDRRKFFSAVQLVYEIARDCAAQCDKLEQEKANMMEKNNQLAEAINRLVQNKGHINVNPLTTRNDVWH